MLDAILLAVLGPLPLLTGDQLSDTAAALGEQHYFKFIICDVHQQRGDALQPKNILHNLGARVPLRYVIGKWKGAVFRVH